MCEESWFTSKTYAMLQCIPVDIRQKFPNSRTFTFACVKINGYNTVVVYKKVIPIAIVAEWGTHINPLAVYDHWSMKSIRKADALLTETERFLDVPRYVYPA
jgi:hypothetical protein